MLKRDILAAQCIGRPVHGMEWLCLLPAPGKYLHKRIITSFHFDFAVIGTLASLDDFQGQVRMGVDEYPASIFTVHP